LPEIRFETVAHDWNPADGPTYEVLIVALRAADADAACQWLNALPSRTRAVVILHEADVATTRKLLRDGAAADVLPAPVTAPAIASSLDRVFSSIASTPRSDGALITMLKAGGGVGATALATQLAAMLARRGESVCLADLDLQSGLGAAYMDIPEAISVLDVMGAGAEVADAPFAEALAAHGSGARLLAAPAEITPIETLAANQVEALLTGLKGAYGLTIVDLPTVWCSWTHEVVRASDGVTLVTHLTVPHIQLLKRQLKMLSLYQLDSVPVSIVCNAVTSEQLASLSVKAAERSLGRNFDAVLPDDAKVMTAAVNQGVELSTVRRGTKLEKAIAKVADGIAARVAQRGR
jgi:pilus assembly protein CpaE